LILPRQRERPFGVRATGRRFGFQTGRLRGLTLSRQRERFEKESGDESPHSKDADPRVDPAAPARGRRFGFQTGGRRGLTLPRQRKRFEKESGDESPHSKVPIHGCMVERPGNLQKIDKPKSSRSLAEMKISTLDCRYDSLGANT
jgi:hypothetical protein